MIKLDKVDDSQEEEDPKRQASERVLSIDPSKVIFATPQS